MKNELLMLIGGINAPSETVPDGSTIWEIIILVVIAIIVVVFLYIIALKNPDKKNLKSIKQKNIVEKELQPCNFVMPIITYELTRNKIIIDINVEDKYSYVIIEFELYDVNRSLIKLFTLQADNLELGESRRLEYLPNKEELFNTKYINYRISDIK